MTFITLNSILNIKIRWGVLLEVKEFFEKSVEGYDISDMMTMKPLDLEALMLERSKELDADAYKLNDEYYKAVRERLANGRNSVTDVSK